MDDVPGREVAGARARPRGIAQHARHAAIDTRTWLSRLPRLIWMTVPAAGLVLAGTIAVGSLLPPEPKDPNLVGQAIDHRNELERAMAQRIRLTRPTLGRRGGAPSFPAFQDTHVRYRGEIVPLDSLERGRR